jgi:hypothetical protein
MAAAVAAGAAPLWLTVGHACIFVPVVRADTAAGSFDSLGGRCLFVINHFCSFQHLICLYACDADAVPGVSRCSSISSAHA